MADIFISYKREEQPFAKKLADAFQNRDWTVWWDPEVRAGERFHDIIDKELKKSKCVVVLWSKLSVESQNVKDEASYALKRNKLVPVMIEDVDLPYWFERINTEQLNEWDGSDNFPGYQKLVSDISKIIADKNERRRKATEQKAEKERRRKQEEERNLREKEQRKAEEKREFEEEQKRIEAARKTEEERKQKETAAGRIAEENKQHKEKEELQGFTKWIDKNRKMGWLGPIVTLTWFGCAFVLINVSATFFKENNIKWIGKYPGGTSGVVFGSLVGLASGLFLSIKRRHQLKGIEIVLYWLGCSWFFILLSLNFFKAANIEWFGKYSSGESGVVFGSLVGLASGLLAIKLWRSKRPLE